MNQLPYKLNDKKSIIKYAKQLTDGTLRTKCSKTEDGKKKNKGGFGQILEKFYFLYEPNSDNEPDFKEVGLELKSSPIKKLKRLHYVSKERLVLNIINYLDVVNQTFESSTFWKKNKNLLLVFYLYEADKNILDYKIEIVDEWDFPEIDLEIIKNDWQIINDKINIGKAHELSEGDTLYLAACTKGSKGGNLRDQPNSKKKAKQRAYSLKQGYVNHIIATLVGDTKENYGRLIPSLNSVQTNTLEEIVVAKFKKYYKKPINEIQNILKISLNQKAKSFYANLAKAILGIELNKSIEEFEKADITLKTIRLDENNLPKEEISFPAFKFEEIINEKWESAALKDTLEHKFLFIFFKYENNKLLLEKAIFWNMPYSDIQKAKKVWMQTKKVIKDGNIVKEIRFDKNGKEKRITNFPNKKSNDVAHVRPHARDSKDTYPLPTVDKFTGKKEYTKHCFWLNREVLQKLFNKNS